MKAMRRIGDRADFDFTMTSSGTSRGASVAHSVTWRCHAAGALLSRAARGCAAVQHRRSVRLGAHSVATDGFGNVFVLGSFQGTVNFGGANLTSAGGYDVFLAKFSPNGTHLWSQRFGSNIDDNGVAVAVDASGSPIITGRFSLTVNFG